MDQIPVNSTLLEQLGLIQPNQWPTIKRHARRRRRKGARYLFDRQKTPDTFSADTFSATWIDTLLQLGYITPYQAKLLQEGNAESLKVGSNVILNRRESLGWANCFDAYRIDDRRPIHLAVLQNIPKDRWEPISKQLIQLREKDTSFAEKVSDTFFMQIEEVGIDDQLGVWITSPPCLGESVVRWMVQHGRIPPDVVLEIARKMIQGLSQLESQEQTHGDLRAATLFLSREQGLQLLLPGVREIVRPRESFAETGGPIDIYDGLSPERAAEGTLPDIKSDLFATGSLWWQMLTGRTPMLGGDGKAKLRAAAQKKVDNVKKHAADIPKPLASAITACTASFRNDRPSSFNEVATILGKSDSQSARAIHRWIRRNRETALPIVSTSPLSRQTRYFSRAIVALGILIAIVALGLAADRFFNPPEPKVVVLSKPNPTLNSNPHKQPNVPEHKIEPNTSQTNQLTDPTKDSSNSTITTLTTDETTIVLDSNRPISVESLEARLKPGLKVVTSPPDQRAKVIIHGDSLQIKVSHVRFENIDFITSKPLKETESNQTKSSDTHQAMIELRGSEATFTGCTFGSHPNKETLPRTVLHWIFPDPKEFQTTLHNGRITLKNCLFGNATGTAIHAEVHAAVAVELHNVLHLGGGPMLFLETPPKPDEPWRIQAEHVTLRESGPFWACRYQSTIAGHVRIEASNSVLAPKGTQPLLLFVGENDPTLIFREIEWTGRETLVKKTTPTASWQDNSGNREVINDFQASIEGLARSLVEFTGPTENKPSSNVLQTWDAPLTSETPPGIDAKRLP